LRRHRRRGHSVAAVTLVSGVETEFLLISEAVAFLEAGMFGGAIKQPKLLEAIKKDQPRLSVGSGHRTEKAATTIQGAIVGGDLAVHVFAQPIAGGVCRPLHVPIHVLRRLHKVKGGLPDYPIRLPFNLLRDRAVASELFAALSASALHLRRAEYVAWYQKERRKRRWLSQAGSGEPRIGRPSKQTDKLLTSIEALTGEGKWSARDGIASLVRLLTSNGAPNRYLIRRAVQRLFERTGDLAYRVVPRNRAKGKPLGSHT
jgi:hypothetical protein